VKRVEDGGEPTEGEPALHAALQPADGRLIDPRLMLQITLRPAVVQAEPEHGAANLLHR